MEIYITNKLVEPMLPVWRRDERGESVLVDPGLIDVNYKVPYGSRHAILTAEGRQMLARLRQTEHKRSR